MKPKIVILLVCLILLLLILLLVKTFSQKKASPSQPGNIPVFNSSSSPFGQQIFNVTSTSPGNGATDISPGEITITFDSDRVISSSDSFELSFNPKLSSGYQFASTFPTKQVKIIILNGLTPSTKYTVSLNTRDGSPIYSWDFSTKADTGGLSSSAYETKIELDYISKNYPLHSVTPYSNADFSIDYAGKPLTLVVNVKNPDVEKVKQEVIDWIKSKGVDPSTHTINYVNAF